MRGGVAISILFAAMVSMAQPAMSSAANPAGRCVLVGGDKLLQSLRLSQPICAQVESAITAEAPGAHYTVELRILSPARLAATLVVEGHTLPVQNFAVMDGNLSDASIGHFARSLAAIVAKATKA